MNNDICHCKNNNCVRRLECKRYSSSEITGIYWIQYHRGKCAKCKDFIKNENYDTNRRAAESS